MGDATVNGTPRHSSRWRTFKLRTLIISAILIQLPLIYFYYARDRVLKEKAALKALGPTNPEQTLRAVHDETTNIREAPRTTFSHIARKTGSFEYWYPVTWLIAAPCALDSRAADHLRNLPYLEAINLHAKRIEVGARLPTNGLPRLTHLQIAGCTPPVEFISSVGQCKRLRLLEIENCCLSDSHLQEIGGLTQLKGLSLSGVTLTKTEWGFLDKLSNLEYLSIDSMVSEPFPLDKVPASVRILHASRVVVDVSQLTNGKSSQLRAAMLKESNLTHEELKHFLTANPQVEAIGFSPRSTTTDLERVFPNVSFNRDPQYFVWR